MLFNRRKLELPTPDQALKGRTEQWFTPASGPLTCSDSGVVDLDRFRLSQQPVKMEGAQTVEWHLTRREWHGKVKGWAAVRGYAPQ